MLRHTWSSVPALGLNYIKMSLQFLFVYNIPKMSEKLVGSSYRTMSEKLVGSSYRTMPEKLVGSSYRTMSEKLVGSSYRTMSEKLVGSSYRTSHICSVKHNTSFLISLSFFLMYATCFDLYLGHLQACQHKNIYRNTRGMAS
jgi:hypothetical protein